MSDRATPLFINGTGRFARSILASWIFMLLFCAEAAATRLEVPIRFDTGYLTSLLQETLFPDDNPVSVWGDESGCNDLSLASPNAVIENQRFYVVTDASAQTGIQFGSRCVGLLRWSGKIKAEQRVDIVDPRGRIAFSTVDTELLDSNGRAGKISNKFWDLAKEYVHPHLDRLRIDLVSAVTEMKQLLPLFLDAQDLERNQKMIDSIHLESLSITDGQINTLLQFDIELAQAEVKPLTQPALSEEEIQQFVESWEQWDAFLVFIVKTAARDVLDANEKDQLLDTLIQARYDLVEVLSSAEVQSADALRQSFMTTWRLLSPVFHNLSLTAKGKKSLRFLGFIAAADALEALGQLGPVTGWDISVDGLRRLARMLIEDQNIDPLERIPDADPDMRELFEFDRSLQLPPAGLTIEPDFGLNVNQGSQINAVAASEAMPRLLDRVLATLPVARANTPSDDEALDLDKVAPERENLEIYLAQVQQLLNSVTFGTLMTKPLDATYRRLFHNLVLTTAWQETCWRQYKTRDGELTTMTSSAGALGMMQIMPKVWRGFYDSASLANDIEYNAAAGTEILHRYLVRYALRKGEDKHEGGIENLAKASYAAYNGGPKHLNRYRKSDTAKSLKKIDRSFWQKYQQIRDGNQLAVKQCYPYF